MNEQQATTGGGELLTVFDSIKVRKESTITDADRRYCERQQQALYATLDRIMHWYGIFRAEAERYADTHRVRFAENGTVEHRDPYRPWNRLEPEYGEYEFLPFKSIDALAESYAKAVRTFESTVISYFNHTYGVAVPGPDFDRKEALFGSRPVYRTCVDTVIGHLGGKGFREVAENEALERFRRFMRPRGWREPRACELKGGTIRFHKILRFDDFYIRLHNKNHIHHGYDENLRSVCEGIAFGAAGMLNAGSSFIGGFDRTDVDLTGWYGLDTETAAAAEMKFYGNGRIDVRFADEIQARRCYRKLGLDNSTPIKQE